MKTTKRFLKYTLGAVLLSVLFVVSFSLMNNNDTYAAAGRCYKVVPKDSTHSESWLKKVTCPDAANFYTAMATLRSLTTVDGGSTVVSALNIVKVAEISNLQAGGDITAETKSQPRDNYCYVLLPNSHSTGGVDYVGLDSWCEIISQRNKQAADGAETEDDTQVDDGTHPGTVGLSDDYGTDPNATNTNNTDDKSDPCSIVHDGGLSGAFTKITHPITWFTCAIANTLTDWADSASLMVGKVLCFDPINPGACTGSAAVEASGGPTPDDPLNEEVNTNITGDDVGYDNNSAKIKTIWNKFRNIANTLFVVALLVIIISEALGFGFLDAYTVKKMLPKLIVAIVLCNLSYDICGQIIQFINIIGVNIGHAIVSTVTGGDPNFIAKGVQSAAASSPSGTGGAFTGSMFQGLIVIGLGYAIFAIVASGGLGLAPILIFLLSLFIAAMMAFLMLLLRQIILVILIVVSPLVFAIWVLPSGESLFRKWWKIFSELLLMFPIIMGMLAMGQVVAFIMGITPDAKNLGFNGILAMIALVAPFFAIPATFKMSVSSLNGVSNFLSSKGKGIMDKGKNWRDNNSQWGWRKGMKQMARKSARDRKGLESLDSGSRLGRYRQRAVTGAKSKRGLNSAANKAILGNLQAQQEKTEYDESLASLQHETQGMGRAAMLEQLRGIATGSGDSTQKRAAIHMMTQQKDAAGLQAVQEHMLGSGEHQVWNRAMADNYSDLQSAMPHLATELTDNMTVDGLQDARLKKLNGLSDEAIAGMHDATWQQLAAPLTDENNRPILDANGNPTYALGDRGREFADLAERRYNGIIGPDRSNPANPRLAGQMAQSTHALFGGQQHPQPQPQQPQNPQRQAPPPPPPPPQRQAPPPPPPPPQRQAPPPHQPFDGNNNPFRPRGRYPNHHRGNQGPQGPQNGNQGPQGGNP